MAGMAIILTFIACLLIIVTGLVSAELLAKTKLPKTWLRKFAHIGIAIIVIGCSLFVDYREFAIGGIIAAVAMLAVKQTGVLKSLSSHFAKRSYGEVMFPLGVTVSAILAHNLAFFIVSIAIVGLADTAAYVIGKSIKSRELIFTKTIAGSVAFFIVAFIILLFVVSPLKAGAIGAVATIAEMIGIQGTDNILIPFAVVGCLNLLT
jgi:dolichol kinase